ncbi:conserved membrane protein of unknown function [Candidatus Hydrogenisulfobacillus filiaventi]|uniref:DUF4013 domain-containing protein n=1 Tax=Candidatus Hydrogenisulfobacillus filiaventi TaxID=2707344 RepID=A0A6F8ZKD9_9FIRM|nr:hypothetical protein [Bacillota bacterium]CAB1130230.1 conserved membrane protein of unknown function [Candidatus Hydrogenisulfobacillus filiaventi]
MSVPMLFRSAWEELRRRPQLWMLAFWYLFVNSGVQLLVADRLAPQLPAWLRHPSPALFQHPLPALPPGLAVKLVLVFLSFLLILLPFSTAGLYGGAAAVLKNEPGTGIWTFWRYAVREFWRGLGFEVLLVLTLAVVSGLLAGISALFGVAGQAAGLLAVFEILAMIVVIAVLALWFAATLYALGAVFYGLEAPLKAFGAAWSWTLRHVGPAWQTAVLFLTLAIGAWIVTAILALIPVLGGFLAIALSALVLDFLAVLGPALFTAASRPGEPPRADV